MDEAKNRASLIDSKERNVKKLTAHLQEYFSPRIIGEVNDVYIKITKTKGDDVPWHSHDGEDEMFYILEGSLVMELENEEKFVLSEGEFFIVKKGVKHRVSSEQDCYMILIENKSTKHVGDVESHITRSIEEQL